MNVSKEQFIKDIQAMQQHRKKLRLQIADATYSIKEQGIKKSSHGRCKLYGGC